MWCLIFTSLNAQNNTVPWIKSIDPQEIQNSIHTLNAQANVTVSDGLHYQTHSIYHDPQRAIFQITYPDRSLTQGVEGKYFWQYDGKKEREAPTFVEGFVLGHQFHAQLLFFDRLHPNGSPPEITEFYGVRCNVVSTPEAESSFKIYYSHNGLPLAIEIVRKNEPNIVSRFEDWREVSGIKLPYNTTIDDGSRIFTYAFTDIIFNEGSIDVFRAPDSVLTEEQRLLRIHRTIMDDHFWGNMDRMNARNGDSLVIVNEGEVYNVRGEESKARMNRMIGNRDYTVYDDLIRPQIKISQDGTLAWVIVKVLAKGIRYDEEKNPKGPLEFTSAWIELYEKTDGEWRMIGNVSNFMEGRK